MIGFSKLGRSGRLGNQLWQVASTIGIANTRGEEVVLPKWDYRPYFRVPDQFFPDLPGPRGYEKIWTPAENTEQVSHIDPRARDYLQDLGLWEHIAPQVWSWFQPSERAMDKIRDAEFILDDGYTSPLSELPRPILSVHVRRGDNAKQPNNNHPLRPWSYYEDSIAALDGQFESLVVFSDDPEWCRAQFQGYEIKYPTAFFVGTPRAKEHEIAYKTGAILDWIDLQMMSMCDRHIISNSTYSWWGAFLSHDESPIYPWPFFGSDLSYIDCGLMFPDTWVRHDHGQQYV